MLYHNKSFMMPFIIHPRFLGLFFAENGVLQIYTRMFLGPHKKVNQKIVFKIHKKSPSGLFL
jgi:hypothetical protein